MRLKITLGGFTLVDWGHPTPEEIELREAQETLALYKRRAAEDLETDSLIGSCSCLTKTTAASSHKIGCRFRLIAERNRIRSEARDLADYAEVLLCNAVPMTHLPQDQWRDILRKWMAEKHRIFPLGRSR